MNTTRSGLYLLILLLGSGRLAAQSPPAPISAEPPHMPLFAFEKVIQAENDRRERCPNYFSLADGWTAIVQRYDALGAPATGLGDRLTLRDHPLAGWWSAPQPACASAFAAPRAAPAGNPALQRQPNAEVGVFTRNLVIPPDWAQRPVFLRLQPLNCKVTLKVDQSPLLELPTSDSAVDFNVSSLLSPGPHEFHMIIERRNRALADGPAPLPGWSYAGMQEPAYLYCPPAVHILDFAATPVRDAESGADMLNLRAVVRNLSSAAPPPLKLEAYLLDPQGQRVFNRILALKVEPAAGQSATYTLTQRVPNPIRSTAEAPYRYAMLFALVEPGDRPVQVERMAVEFR